MGVKPAGADLILKNGIFNGSRYLGARNAADAEIDENPYSRILMTLADWQASGRRYENKADENFPLPTEAWEAIARWSLHTHATAQAGNSDLLMTQPIRAGGAAAAIGAAVGWDAGLFELGFTGHVTVAGSLKCCNEGLLSGTRYLSVHLGPPGDNGAQLIDQPLQVFEADWSFSTAGTQRRARNNKVFDFGALATDVTTPMYVALRAGAATNSDVLWADQFSPLPSDPGLGYRMRFLANALVIPITIDV